MDKPKTRPGTRLLGKGPDFVAIVELLNLRAQEDDLISTLFRSMVKRLDEHSENPQCQRCLCGDVLTPDEFESLARRLRETQEQDKERQIHTEDSQCT